MAIRSSYKKSISRESCRWYNYEKRGYCCSGNNSNNIPVVVVSSGEECKNKDWEEGQRELSGKAKKQIWDVVGKAPHDVWRNEEGKKMLKKRLSELVRAVKT